MGSIKCLVTGSLVYPKTVKTIADPKRPSTKSHQNPERKGTPVQTCWRAKGDSSDLTIIQNGLVGNNKKDERKKSSQKKLAKKFSFGEGLRNQAGIC